MSFTVYELVLEIYKIKIDKAFNSKFKNKLILLNILISQKANVSILKLKD